jgi:hypothetical protein
MYIIKKEVILIDINIIRNLPGIKGIINSCAAFGRTWGRRSSELHGSHIAFVNPDELVLVIEDKKSHEIKIINFIHAGKTRLGEKIINELKSQGITFEVK